MKGLLAWFTRGLLTAALVAVPSFAGDDAEYRSDRYDGTSASADVSAQVNGNMNESEVHPVESGVYAVGNGYHVNVQGQRVAWPGGGVLVAQPGGMFVSQNGRIYYVHDDPRYDLSGSGNTLILGDEGAAYKVESGNVPAAFAQAGGASKEVVTVPAEYRQHWLAVAAGDRPVRNMTSVPVAPQGPTVTFMPVYFAREDAGNGNGRTTYTSGTAKRTNGTYKRTSTAKAKKTSVRKTNGYRKTSSAVAKRNGSTYRTASAHRNGNGYRRNGATTTAYTAETSTRTRVGTTYARVEDHTRNLYQLGSSWYQWDGDTWSKSNSWRGPFVEVSKGTVPREVKKAAKKPFRD